MSQDPNNPNSPAPPASGDAVTNEEQIRQLSRIVCICKGINLGRVLKAMDGCETVADVNRKAGTGNGGCAGERCGPRIKVLLRKWKEAKEKEKEKKP